jgi:hypothetical protein
MIWEPHPKSLRIASAIVAGFARLSVGRRFNFAFVVPVPLTPGVSQPSPFDAADATSAPLPTHPLALTAADTRRTLLAPAFEEPSMDDTQGPPSQTITAANDETSPEVAIDAVVMTFARLLGRQMARERFYAAQEAANAPAESGEA